MSTSTPTRPGQPTSTPDPDRWAAGRPVTTEHAPRTFDTACTHRLPNTASKTNQATPR